MKEEENSEEDEESELEEEIEELEEEIQDEDEIFDEDIIQFIPSIKSKSTALSKINSSAEIPQNLEENLRATTHLPDVEEDEAFKYGNKKGEAKESEYQNFNPNYSAEIITTTEKLRDRNFREVGFSESSEARVSPEKSFERYEQVKRFDQNDFRKSDLEKKEIKYKPSH